MRAWRTATDAGLPVALVGDADRWWAAAGVVGVPLGGARIDPVRAEADPSWGHLDGIGALATAVRGCQDGTYAAVTTGPLHKADLLDAGFPYAGHTPYLAALCGRSPEEAVMVFAGGRLVVALATVHIPLSAVPGALTQEAIARAARGAAWVVERLGTARPRIAVCGLNPHAGEAGHLGHEDEATVRPAVQALRAAGLDASGPWPADTLFGQAAAGRFDAVVACYHDQGLIPVKTLDFGRTVNVTAGLPIVRTSVDHGTARDLAGTGRADPGSTWAALQLAARLAGRG